MMHVDALITDLDGTFWATDMSIHEESLRVVARLDAEGVPFVVATGRRAQGALHGLRPADLHRRPAILMNGALARDELHGPSFLIDDIRPEHVEGVLEAFRDQDLEPIAYVDHPDTDLIIGPGGAAGEAYLARAVGYAVVDSLDHTLASSTVIGFGAFGFPYELLAPIADHINGHSLATAIIGVSHFEGKYGLMIQGHAVDKQTGIEAWCQRSGTSPDRLAVVGDGHNDIEMLKAAKIAIVPSNAPDDIKELADAIIAPNEVGGWEEIPSIIGLG